MKPWYVIVIDSIIGHTTSQRDCVIGHRDSRDDEGIRQSEDDPLFSC